VTETVIKDVGSNRATADAGDEGYRKSLQARHINMIAIGGAIGTGLFLGAGGRLAQAGPSTTGIADITAIALYAHYWSVFKGVPQWPLALLALVIVLTINLVSVRLCGEMEFWFALVKVATLAVFMAIGDLPARHPAPGGRHGARPAAHLRPRRALPAGRAAHGPLDAGSGLRLRFGRARGHRRGGDGEPPRGHAAGNQLVAFLVSVVVLMAFDKSGRIVLAGVPVIVLALVVGWFGVRKRIDTSVLEQSA
jgi:L-asparagine transporter-like permease